MEYFRVFFELDPAKDSLFVIPDHAACGILHTFVVILRFHLARSVSSIVQFLGNFLRSIPGEDGSSSPIRYTNVFSHAELDLPIDWPPITAVFETSGLVVTQPMHILSFFAPKFWISMLYSVDYNFL